MSNTLTSVSIPYNSQNGQTCISNQVPYNSLIYPQGQGNLQNGGTGTITWPNSNIATWYPPQPTLGSSYVYVENIGTLQVRKAEGGWIVVKEGKEHVCIDKQAVLALL